MSNKPNPWYDAAEDLWVYDMSRPTDARAAADDAALERVRIECERQIREHDTH